MQYRFDGEFHRLSRVTGPTHNFLALALSDAAWGGAPSVEPLDVGDGGAPRLESGEVARAVCDGVADANREFGCDYAARRIQFVPSDSPPAAVYRHLAREIVRHAAVEARAA
jgi:hypothetical protein